MKLSVIGKFNVCNEPLIDIRHTILPPLHVKLGIVKQFVKNLDKESLAFEHLSKILPHLSKAKLREGVLIGPDIRKTFADDIFKSLLPPDMLLAWNSFITFCDGFLVKTRSVIPIF